ncbi:MAG: hypothetical protein ACRDKI_10660 [Solirubrobacterales bacterium]
MRKLRAPSPALIVATCALVFSMAGTGYAVNKINGSQIKKGTVSGKALKKNTLTGRQIKESKLGKVPSAKTADDAAKLAGADPTTFARTSTFSHVFQTMSYGEPDKTLVASGDISVRLRCEQTGGNDQLSVYATTTTDGALLDGEDGDNTVLDTTTPATSSIIGEGLSTATTLPTATQAYDLGYDDTGFVINAANDHLITLLEGSSTKILNRGGHNCIYGATFIVR